MAAQPFPVPITEIHDVRLVTDELITSHLSPGDIQSIGLGINVGAVHLGPSNHLPVYALPTWQYSQFDPGRLAKLSKFYTPKSLADEVVSANPPIVHFDLEWGRRASLQNFHRAVVRLQVGLDHFDQLYNGPAGIRGQHFLDPVFPDAGKRFRDYFIKQWKPQLKAYAQSSSKWTTPQGQKDFWLAGLSLNHARAKIWQTEHTGIPGHHGMLTVPRWQSFRGAKEGDPIQTYLQLEAERFGSSISGGEKAEYQDTITIMGHWIDKQGNFAPTSALDLHKVERDRQIAYLGFS